jgi:hypothetical protein
MDAIEERLGGGEKALKTISDLEVDEGEAYISKS